jgi:uncharacterized protein YndB with AHSA1/START domain
MRFSNTITIDRAPAAVFAYLADFENLPRWNYAISDTRKLSTGPVGVGSRYQQTRTVPAPGDEIFEVTEFEPHHKLTIRGSFGPFPAEISYTIHAEGTATTVINTVRLQPPRPLNLLAPIATHQIKSAVAANLEVLRQTLERA